MTNSPKLGSISDMLRATNHAGITVRNCDRESGLPNFFKGVLDFSFRGSESTITCQSARRRPARPSRPPEAPPGGGLRGAPEPATTRRSVPSAWPGSWAESTDSSGPAHSSTSIFHFPVETGHSDTRSGGRDGRRTCRPAGPSDCPSVSAVGIAIGALSLP